MHRGGQPSILGWADPVEVHIARCEGAGRPRVEGDVIGHGNRVVGLALLLGREDRQAGPVGPEVLAAVVALVRLGDGVVRVDLETDEDLLRFRERIWRRTWRARQSYRQGPRGGGARRESVNGECRQQRLGAVEAVVVRQSEVNLERSGGGAAAVLDHVVDRDRLTPQGGVLGHLERGTHQVGQQGGVRLREMQLIQAGGCADPARQRVASALHLGIVLQVAGTDTPM